MAIMTTCPNCKARFRLADDIGGKKVKCQKCQHIFVVPTASEAASAPTPSASSDSSEATAAMPPPDEDPDMATAVTVKAPKWAEDEEEDEDEEKGKKKSGPPPVSGKGSTSNRSGTKSRREPRSAGMSGGMIALIAVLIGGGLMGCAGCLGVAGWFMSWSGEKKDAGPIAAAAKKDGDNPIRDQKKDGIKKEVQPPPPPPPPPGVINVTFGADGSFRTDNVLTKFDARNERGKLHKLYQVRFEAGRTYQIDMIHNKQNQQNQQFLDCYLYLFDDANVLIAQDDDGGGFPNARIVTRATRAGVFRIEATSLSGQHTGAYTLIVQRVN